MGGAAGAGGEYIEGTATGEFTMIVNHYRYDGSRAEYKITPNSEGRWRWRKPDDLTITDMSEMFDNCSTLLSIDKWTVDTSTVTDMS